MSTAFAQGGGASSTGTIQGRVTDSQGAVLPGVTVTATSPALIQPQTTVTSETGNYRFPAVPPGNFELTYELAGFNTLKRSGISITLGFTANVNVELALATLQETVTVSGESPVIDTSTTRVQQNFKMEQLQSIPNGRDMWALLAVTPSVQMAPHRRRRQPRRHADRLHRLRHDRPGARADRRHQHHGRHRRRGLLFRLRVARRSVPRHVGPVGGNAEPRRAVAVHRAQRLEQFQGEYHLDWYNNSLQGSNIPDEYIAPTAFNNSPIREHSNEIDRYYDHDINVGGPIKKDKVWIFGTYREQFNAVAQPQLPVRQHLQHQAVEPGRQGHLPDEPEEQADWLLPVGPEGTAQPPAVRDLHLRVAGADLHAGLGQLGLQG